MWRPLTAQRLTAPHPNLPFRVCLSGGFVSILAHVEEHLSVQSFPVLGTLARWRPQSVSLATSGACLGSRVEGWAQAPVLSHYYLRERRERLRGHRGGVVRVGCVGSWPQRD